MNYLRIWHDNSGGGNYASWYLSSMVVRDVQTNEVTEFICNNWLAQEKDSQVVIACQGTTKPVKKLHFWKLFPNID